MGGSWFRAAQATHEARVRAGVEKDVVLEDAGDGPNAWLGEWADSRPWAKPSF